MDGRTIPTSTELRPSIPSITHWTDWWTEWTDGSDSVSVHQSVHQSVHSVHLRWTENSIFWWNSGWTGISKKFDIPVRPIVHQKTEFSVHVWWTEWTDWWTGGRTEMNTDPSVHSVHQSVQFVDGFMDGMDGRILVEVGFVRPSIKCILWTDVDGRTLVESPLYRWTGVIPLELQLEEITSQHLQMPQC